MKAVSGRVARWSAVAGLALALAACGGGGGGDTPVEAKAPDARNGTYTLVAADAEVYTLVLDFDAATYHVSGAGVDQSGAVTQQGTTYSFQPGNATGATGASTTRFQVATDAIVGELPLSGGTVPFIAARKFVNTIADAAGTYDMLGRVVDATGAPPDTTIQQGQVTADGYVHVCNDPTIYDIPNCPGASLAVGTLTVSGDVFNAAFTTGNVPFRVARVGADKVYLRGSPSSASTRRFVVGVPSATTFNGDTFAGATTEPAWGTMTFTATDYSSTGTSPSGATTGQAGTTVVVARVPGLRRITTPSTGYFFAARASELGMVVAAQNNTSALGFVAIGRKQ